MWWCFVGHFTVFSLVKDLWGYQTIRLTHPRYTKPACPFTLVQFANNMPLILLPEADQRRSEISPLAASETFTQRRRRELAEDPHMQTAVWMGLVLNLFLRWRISHKPKIAPLESYDGWTVPRVALVRGLRQGRSFSLLAASCSSQVSVCLDQLDLWQHMVNLTGGTGWSWLHRGLSWQ